MRYTVVVKCCSDTGMYVGYVPSLAGVHSQGETLEELNRNLTEVFEMLLAADDSHLVSKFAFPVSD